MDMKKLAITCVLLSSAAASFAQTAATAPATPPPPQAQQAAPNRPMMTPEQMAKRRATMEAKQYSFTAEQTPKAEAVELEFFQALEKYRATGAQPSQGQMGNLTARRDAKMKELMTPEQYAKFDAGRNRERMAPNTPANAPQPAPKN